MEREGTFHKKLKQFIHEYILLGYKVSEKFLKSEIFGMTSQVRRALLSIMLNYVEGFGRSKKKVMLNFYETSFGSLQESIYVFYLAACLKYISAEEYTKLFSCKEQIAKMLWKTIEGLRNDIEKEP
ncbi:MAG TPA: four helix bundle protein [Patescibacteria group bacterium]|nr:four helix bundle protein [Patescibacteria group bacterium]